MLVTLINVIVWIAAFVVAITFHEYAHAWTAYRLGDPTAKLKGRLSFNPLRHYDPVGTTLLLILVVLNALGFSVPIFGWAKPVPGEAFNLRKPQRDSALISGAGPLANLIVAAIFSILLRITLIPFSPLSVFSYFLIPFIVINVSLGIFNLIPIHPLDGGKILVGLLPENEGRKLEILLRRYGFLLLIFLIFPIINGNSLLSLIVSPTVNFLLKLFIP